MDSFRQECGGGFREGSKETMSVGREKEEEEDEWQQKARGEEWRDAGRTRAVGGCDETLAGHIVSVTTEWKRSPADALFTVGNYRPRG